MYRAGIEGILGIRREGDSLVLEPCVPAAWPGFDATVRVGASRYEIRVENASHRCGGVSHATLDGAPITCAKERVQIPLDGKTHRLHVSI
jgi:cyclic beta-1,2-glucan synthetase